LERGADRWMLGRDGWLRGAERCTAGPGVGVLRRSTEDDRDVAGVLLREPPSRISEERRDGALSLLIVGELR